MKLSDALKIIEAKIKVKSITLPAQYSVSGRDIYITFNTTSPNLICNPSDLLSEYWEVF